MKDLISRLEDRERKTVSTLAAVFGSAIILLLVFGVRARLDANRAATRRAGIETNWRTSERNRKAAVEEWEKWTRAEADIRDLRRTWFYDMSEGIRAIRGDIGEVLAKAGVAAMDFNYGESDVVRDRLRRVTVRFAWGGTYPAFRKVLETLETHPRALHVSKIVFRNIGGSPGYVEAEITLEGYEVHE